MDKMYRQKCNFKITIEGTYCVGNLFAEELESLSKDIIWDYVTNNITNYYQIAKVEISNEKYEEE